MNKDDLLYIKLHNKKINIKKFFQKNNKVSISDDCYCSILILKTKNSIKNILITADIIWFSDKSVRLVREYISKEQNLEIEKIVLSASHTHGTPNPEISINTPAYSQDFDNYIIAALLECYNTAIKKPEKIITMVFKRFLNHEFSINRRKSALSFKKGFKYKMQNLPNFSKKVDESIDLIDLINIKTRKIEGSIIKVNCHPVSAPKNTMGADYIGKIKNNLKKRSNVIFFLQGFCGDIRPKMIKQDKTIKDYFITFLVGKRFRKPNAKDSKEISNSVVRSVVNAEKEKYSFSISNIGDAREIKYGLKLEDGSIFKKKLNILVWNWGKLIIIFLNGEILSGYNVSQHKKNTIICVGYANGMIGYLPTAEDIVKGGYEVDKSRKNFNIGSRISKVNEVGIKKKITKMLDLYCNK